MKVSLSLSPSHPTRDATSLLPLQRRPQTGKGDINRCRVWKETVYIQIWVKGKAPPKYSPCGEVKVLHPDQENLCGEMGRGKTESEHLSLSPSHPTQCIFLHPQPPTVVCKMEAHLEHIHVAYTFFAHLAQTYMLYRCLLTKYLHRSSVGGLLRVRCWL